MVCLSPPRLHLNIMEEEIYDLDGLIEVYDNCVKISLPEMNSIVLSDRELSSSFYNSHLFYDCVDFDRAEFWDQLITHAFKLRKHKRELYRKLGFKRF